MGRNAVIAGAEGMGDGVGVEVVGCGDTETRGTTGCQTGRKQGDEDEECRWHGEAELRRHYWRIGVVRGVDVGKVGEEMISQETKEVPCSRRFGLELEGEGCLKGG